jgi:ABC-2 type transport system permease protein
MKMNNWIPFITLMRKELIRIFRIWPQTLVPPVMMTFLYFVIFGKLVGSKIDGVLGVSYIDFIIPGLIMNTIIANAYMNSASSFFGNKFQRSIEEMLVAPVPNWVIILGFMSGAILRALITGILVLIIATLFTSVRIEHPFMMFFISFIAAFAFSAAGILNGIFARNFDDTSWVSSFLITPLTYLGGVFFSIEMLPKFWQQFAVVNPIFHIVSSYRFSMLGVSSFDPYVSVGVLTLIAIMLFLLAKYMMDKGVGIKE